jgi:hypothetical protein
MLDPNADSYAFTIAGLTLLTIAGAWGLAWYFMAQRPRMQLRRVERQAAEGDPDALRQMRFLDDLGAAFGAGSAQDEERRSELRRNGRGARAELRSVKVGSTRVERGTTAMRPVTMTLEVFDEERERTVTEYVDELYVARLLVGADVPVFIDRLDPDVLAVGWDMA